MINAQHEKYTKWIGVWDKIKDAIAGQDNVKSKGEKYLPKLPGQDDNAYRAYLHRSQYNNLCGRTMQVAIGQLFRKEPITVGIDDFIENINLEGSHFNHFSKEVFGDVLKYNRSCILVDYSDEGQRVYLKRFEAKSVINWRSEIINGDKQLTLVVIKGERCTYVDYEKKETEIYLELYLEDGMYKSREWEEVKRPDGTRGFEVITESMKTPLMAGEPLPFIPFYFVTSYGISEKIKTPALSDIVNINLGHYVNYADYENMLHWTGAKTIITKGRGNKTFPVGASVDLPTDGDAYFLEASSDSGLEKEIRHKEELMAIMGTQLLSGKGKYVASAQTSQISSEGEYATLADIANAISHSMTKVMKIAIEWAGGNSTNINIEYNTDYQVNEIPTGRLTELLGAWQSGGISYETFYYVLNSYEIYPNGWSKELELELINESMTKQVTDRQAKLNSQVDQKMMPVNQPDNSSGDTTIE